MATRCVEVALPAPLFRTFTYTVPEGVATPIPPGSRVLVPFRGLRDSVFAAVAGHADDDGLSAEVAMPGGGVNVVVRGLRTLAPTVTVARR